MQFKKTREIMGELVPGDYYGYDTGILFDTLRLIDPDIQLMNTDESTQLSFSVICLPEYESAVRDAVLSHGTKAAVAARKTKKDNDTFNSPIKQSITALDSKGIRAIREQLIAIATAVNDIDKITDLDGLKKWLKANLALETWLEDGVATNIDTYGQKIKAERVKLK